VKILKTEAKKKKTDGLNSIRYKVEKIEKQPLFTWILASLDGIFHSSIHPPIYPSICLSVHSSYYKYVNILHPSSVWITISL